MMYLFKSKKTLTEKVYTQEEYAEIVNNQPDMLKRFEITELQSRPIIPSLKEVQRAVPMEVKINKTRK